MEGAEDVDVRLCRSKPAYRIGATGVFSMKKELCEARSHALSLHVPKVLVDRKQPSDVDVEGKP